MPQIGWVEILIVVVIAILIIGPKDFPLMIRKIGSLVNSFKSYFKEVQKDISDIENEVKEEVSFNDEPTTIIEKKKND